jgi:hypothetical protein
MTTLGHAELFQPVGNLLHCGHPTVNAIRSDQQHKRSTTRADLLCHRQAVNAALRGRITLICADHPVFLDHRYGE